MIAFLLRGDALGFAARALYTIRPPEFSQVVPAGVFALKVLGKFYQIHLVGVSHFMPRRKQKLTELTDKKVLRKLFPKEIVAEVEKTISKEDKPRKKKK